MSDTPATPQPQANIIHVLKPYLAWVIGILIATAITSGLSLTIPWLIGSSIDRYTQQAFDFTAMIGLFSLIIVGILIFAYIQNIIQTVTAEKVARDLRQKLNTNIAHQSYQDIQASDPSKLLTNITSDIDNIKSFVTFAVPTTISSIIMLLTASSLLIAINWRLGLAVLVIIPLIGITFAVVFGKATKLFTQAQAVIDQLNNVINQTILGSGLIRVLYGRQDEVTKFLNANQDSLSIGLRIVQLFAIIIPSVGFFANLATIIVLLYGGHLIISGDMTLGQIAAFNGYIGLIIWPIIMLGVMSSSTAEASASYNRIVGTLNHQPTIHPGTLKPQLSGEISVKDLTLDYDQKSVLKDMSFTIKPGSKTAIIGPTAAGKTQLLHLMAGLIPPTSGTITYDGHTLEELDRQHFYQQVGLVFQDSAVFNVSLEQNIAFAQQVDPKALNTAISTAELQSLVDQLPNGLQTEVSERGTSLSGGQKQRLMLARALTLNPTILLLDDFTARVDINTESKIITNLAKNYPGLTLVSITQKIDSIKEYDHILVIMEGELLAQGTHQQLLDSSPEYVQIYQSQQSLTTYELPTN